MIFSGTHLTADGDYKRGDGIWATLCGWQLPSSDTSAWVQEGGAPTCKDCLSKDSRRKTVRQQRAAEAAMPMQITVAHYEDMHRHRQEKMGLYLQDLDHQRQVLISYLKVKMHTEDWHGVADVAMDLRELDAEKKGMLVA